MFASLSPSWSISIFIAIVAAWCAFSCFARAISSTAPDASSSNWVGLLDSLHRPLHRAWLLLGLACLMRAGVAVLEMLIGQVAPSPLTENLSSILSLGRLGATLLFCVAIHALCRQASHAWRLSQQTPSQSAIASVSDKGRAANNEYSNHQYDEAEEMLQGDEPKRRTSFSLLIDVLIICASLSVLRWWLLVQPNLDGLAASKTFFVPQSNVGSLLHSMAIAGSLFAVIRLLLALPAWKSPTDARVDKANFSLAIWKALLLGAIWYCLTDWFVFHYFLPYDILDLTLSLMAPLCVGAASYLSRAEMRAFQTQSRFSRLVVGFVSLPFYPFQWRNFDAKTSVRFWPQRAMRLFWRAPSLDETVNAGAEPTLPDAATNAAANAAATNAAMNLEDAPQHSKSTAHAWFRARFWQWRDALTLYLPCAALAVMALRLTWWTLSAPMGDGATSSTRSVPLASGVSTAFHLWWLVLLFAAVGARHLFFNRREQQTMQRLRVDMTQLTREVAVRTRQLLSLHTAGAGLTNTLNRDQIVAAALERMIEAANADAGVVWLCADLDRDLSIHAEHKEPARTFSLAAQAEQMHQKIATNNFAVHAVNGNQNGVETALKVDHVNGAYIGRAIPISSPTPSIPAPQVEEDSSFSNVHHNVHHNDWRLIRSRGYETTGQNALHIMNDALRRGGLQLCSRECSLRRHETGEVYLAPLHFDGEVAGLLGVTRWHKPYETVERRIMDAIAAEVAVALRNAQLYQEAHRRAERDSLTDLLNHRAIQEKIGSEVSRARRESEELTVIVMDLNNFKFFNDTYGHPTGDGVLRTVAACLRETCRPTDILGRYGGDEFIAILPRTGTKKALELCRRIEDRIERESFETHDKDNRHIPISLSFGAAVFPHHGQNTLDLMSVADANLYESKRGGAPITGLSSSAETTEIRQLKDVGVGQSFGVLDALVTAIDNKDHYTRRHSEDVTHWALLMAHELKWPVETQRAVRISGLLHDVGKIAVPDSILRKPGRLNDEEFGVLQQHPVFGALIVKDVPNLPEVLGGIRHHHERFDGKGYPDKLKGEDIPLFGRLLAVPDCFSAMTTDRPYRKALTWAEAFTEIEAGSMTQFDPQMVDAFLEVMANIVSQKNISASANTHHNTQTAQHSPTSPNTATSNLASSSLATSSLAVESTAVEIAAFEITEITDLATASLASTRSALIGETVPVELSAYSSTQDESLLGDAEIKLNSGEITAEVAGEASKATRLTFIASPKAETQAGTQAKTDDPRARNTSPNEFPAKNGELLIVRDYKIEQKLPTTKPEHVKVETPARKHASEKIAVIIAQKAASMQQPLAQTRPKLRHTPRNSLTSLKDSDVFADDQ